MKYKDCTSLADMAAVNSNYLEQDIDDGCWFYQLPNLVNGDNMFYNDTMAELYEGRVPLWHFESNLQSLQSGVNMFKGCSLDAVSVKRIADTLPSTSTGAITLGIHCSLEGDSSVAALLAKIESKGWSVEVEYNLPYGFTELDYLDASGTQYIDTEITPANNRGLAVYAETVRKYDGYVGGLSDNETGEFINAGRYIPGYSWMAGFSGTEPMPTIIPGTYPFSKFFASVNFLNSRKFFMSAEGEVWEANIKNDYNFTTLKTIRLFGVHTHSFAYYWRNPIYSAQISEGTKIIRDFVPVLREADKVAGMWDKVSKQFFENAGTGTFGYKIKNSTTVVVPKTFSLRDPYYVAPSGVYARLVAENELDIVADTDMKEDIAEQEGYTWFANTGEAYDHFGITQQSDGEEVIDA